METEKYSIEARSRWGNTDAYREHEQKTKNYTKRNGQRQTITYLTNAYRVLLTRARQGFIIYLPEGAEDDKTRAPHFYDETFEYLKKVGIKKI